MDVEKSVAEGTEVRKVEMKLRATGIEEILRGLGENGFVNTGYGKIYRTDKGLIIRFGLNVGTFDERIVALSVDFSIPLTEQEEALLPFEEVDAPAATAVPADPAVVP